MRKQKNREVFLLIFLILLLIVINYSFFDNILINLFTQEQIVEIDRIIDGDTIVSNNTSIRLLGINCPEKGEEYSDKATEFLEKEILDREVVLKFGKEKTDMYDRTLAYVFIDNKNINLQLIEKGLANFYFPSGKDTYYKSFKKAWESCIKDNINLCEKSEDKCAECIIINQF